MSESSLYAKLTAESSLVTRDLPGSCKLNQGSVRLEWITSLNCDVVYACVMVDESIIFVKNEDETLSILSSVEHGSTQWHRRGTPHTILRTKQSTSLVQEQV